MAIVNFPIIYFPDPTKGRPLFGGQIYIGEPDTDPQIIANQKTVRFVQEDGTLVGTTQPIILSAGGVPEYNGSPVRLDVAGNYSIKVLDRLGSQSYYVENVFEGTPVVAEDLPDYISAEFATVAKMTLGIALNFSETVNFADYVGRKVTTVVNNTTSNMGGAEYIIKTEAQRIADGDVIDGYGSHYLLGGTAYCAILVADGPLLATQFGLVGGVDTSLIMQSFVNTVGASSKHGILPAMNDLQFTNIELPSSGILIKGQHTESTVITNTSTSTPVFKTGSASRVLWLDMSDFTIVSPDNGTHGMHLRNWEHLRLHNIEITTAPAERSLGSAFFFERDNALSTAFYMDIERLKCDKHERGIHIKGAASYNCNANWIKDCITNDNTTANIHLEHCSGVEIRGGSRELAATNVIMDFCRGCWVMSGYFERPDGTNIHVTNSEACTILAPLLSSSGNVTAVGNAGVKIENSNMISVIEAHFRDTFTSFDVIIDANCKYTVVRDCKKRDRVKGYTSFRVELQNLSSTTIAKNFTRTGGGSDFYEDVSTANEIYLNNSVTFSGKPSLGTLSGPQLLSGTANPTTGVAANLGSLYLRNAIGIVQLWQKTGALDTDWTQIL